MKIKTYTLALFILIFFTFIFLVSLGGIKRYQSCSVAPIPRQIWTYWHDDSPPLFVQQCINSWKILNPDFDVYILSSGNIKDFVKSVPPFDFNNAIPAHQADWARIAVLMERGGIWLDASIILTKSLNYIIDDQLAKGREAFGFHLEKFTNIQNLPIIENWFIASIPYGKFVTAWFFEFNLAMKTENTYIQDLQKDYGIDQFSKLTQNIPSGMYDYFKMHISAQKIIQMNGFVLDTDAAEDGPYLLYKLNDWSDEKYACSLLDDSPSKIPPIIKINSVTRRVIISKIEIGYPTSNLSIYSRFVF